MTYNVAILIPTFFQSKFLSAIKYTLIFIVVLVVLMLVGLFLK